VPRDSDNAILDSARWQKRTSAFPRLTDGQFAQLRTVGSDAAHHDLPSTTLTDPGISLHIPLLIRLELLDSENIAFLCRQVAGSHT